jgi:hypothetical protein
MIRIEEMSVRLGIASDRSVMIAANTLTLRRIKAGGRRTAGHVIHFRNGDDPGDPDGVLEAFLQEPQLVR